MKKLLTISFLFAFVCVFSQPKAKIGMSLEDARKLFPNAIESKYEKTITLVNADTIHGLADAWEYNFTDGKLKSMSFSKYIDVISEANFKKCLKATKEIIADYTLLYDAPDEETEGKQKFVDPYKEHHYGYDVLEARWKNASGQKIKIEFTFFGGKGEYHFIVVINHFEKDYQYYD